MSQPDFNIQTDFGQTDLMDIAPVRAVTAADLSLEAAVAKRISLREQAEIVGETQPRQSTARKAPTLVELKSGMDELRLVKLELLLQAEDLVRLQVKLDAARAHYSDLYDLAPAGYFTLSASGQILQSNRTAEILLGVASVQMAQQPLSRFIYPEDKPLLRRLLLQMQATKAAYSSEIRVQTPTGYPVWVQMAISAVQSEDGVAGVQVVLNDINQLKLAQATQQPSEQFKQIILDSIDAEIAVLDRDGVVLESNQAWQSFDLKYGFLAGRATPGARVGTCMVSAEPTTRNELGSVVPLLGIRSVMRGQLPIFNLEYPCQVGEIKLWFGLRATPIGPTAPGAVVLTFQDITERKQIEEKLRVSEKSFRHLFEKNTSVMLLLDPLSGEIIDANASATNFYGYARGVLKSMSLAQLKSAECNSMKDNPLDWVKGRHFAVQQHVLANQELRTVEVRATPIQSATGSQLFMLVHDISKRIEGAKQLAKLMQEQQAERELVEAHQRLRDLAAQTEAVREGERKHIAQEVHDELGQILSALRLKMLALDLRFSPELPAISAELVLAKELIDQAIQGVRNVATSLRPPALDMGLVPALDWLCTEFTRRTAIRCMLHLQEQNIDLPEAKAIVVFRIAQEALTNITRYAHATQVSLDIGRNSRGLWLTIQDNGVGFDLKEVAKRKSFGLLGMRERAIAFGGRVEVHTAPGNGAVIDVLIPIAIDIPMDIDLEVFP